MGMRHPWSVRTAPSFSSSDRRRRSVDSEAPPSMRAASLRVRTGPRVVMESVMPLWHARHRTCWDVVPLLLPSLAMVPLVPLQAKEPMEPWACLVIKHAATRGFLEIRASPRLVRRAVKGRMPGPRQGIRHSEVDRNNCKQSSKPRQRMHSTQRMASPVCRRATNQQHAPRPSPARAPRVRAVVLLDLMSREVLPVSVSCRREGVPNLGPRSQERTIARSCR